MGYLNYRLSQCWDSIQGNLFPWIEEELAPLTEKQKQLIAILEMIRIEEFIQPFSSGYRGRPQKSRHSIACAFIAKVVYNMPTTAILIERLHSDVSLRRICGWESETEIPSKSVFSRAYLEFAILELPAKVHEAFIKKYYEGEIVGHVITDASAIEAREKASKKPTEAPQKKQPRGRPKKGQEKPKEMTRIEKQVSGLMTLQEMIEDIPQYCDKGAKKNTKGNLNWWVGYKLHLTVDDHGVPLAGILSSASIHDSQVAIPLTKLTSQRVTSFYDLMDSGYYVSEIIEHSKSLGHVPIIEKPAAPGKKDEKLAEKKIWKAFNLKPAEMVRYEARSTVERVFSRLKDEFCGNFVRVRGSLKVYAHLMFGVLALAADQLIKVFT